MMLKLAVFILFVFSNICAFSSDCHKRTLAYKNVHAKFFSIYKLPKGHLFEFTLSDGKQSKVVALSTDKAFAKQCAIPYFDNESASVLTTTSAAVYPLKVIDKTQHLKYSTATQNIFDDKVRAGLSRFPSPIRIETLIQKKIGLVILDWNFNQLEKLDKAKIAALPLINFKEKHPLGRAEWLVLFSYLFNKQNVGEKLFLEVESNYRKFAELKKKKLSVVYGDYLNGQWVVPASSSFMTTLLDDAGLEKVIDHNAKGPRQFRMEKVLLKSQNAIWLLNSTLSNVNKLKKRISFLEDLVVFNFTKRMSDKGALDFWESGIYRPDKVLKDLYLIAQKKGQRDLFYYESL